MPYVTTSDTHVHYEVDGQGPGLVLVHGTGGDATKVFGHIVDRLAERYTVIRPNLSGSGDTTDDGRELTTELIADQVVAATRDAVDGPVDMLGFSLGAVAVAAAAADHPELVRRIVLAGGWAHSTGARDNLYFDTWRRLLNADRDLFKRFSTLTGFGAAAVDGFGRAGIAASLADEWPPPGIGRQIDLCGRVDLRPSLGRVRAETLVVGFTNDNMVPLEGSRQLHAGIPGSRLVAIDGQGHMDWFADPKEFLEPVTSFLVGGYEVTPSPPM